MRLTFLTVKNFKAIGDEPVTIDIAPITMLFGPDGAGKSSILHALIYLREIFKHGNLNPHKTELGGDILDLGGFRNLVHGKELDKTITLGGTVDYGVDLIDWQGAKVLDYWLGVDWHFRWFVNDEIEEPPINFEIDIRWNQVRQGPYVSRYAIGIENRHLLTVTADEAGKVYISDLDLEHPVLNHNLADNHEPFSVTFREAFEEVVGNNAISVDTVAPTFYLPLELTGNALPIFELELFWEPDFWKDVENDGYEKQKLVEIGFNTFIFGTFKEIAKKSSGQVHIGPLRALPNRDLGSAHIRDLKGWSEGMSAWRFLLGFKESELEDLNRWLGPEHLDIGHQVKIKRVKEVEANSPLFGMLDGSNETIDQDSMKSLIESIPTQRKLYFVNQYSGIELSAHDLGIGVSQVLPVVIGTIKSWGGILSIEQPKLHIHPAVQVELADLFIERATANSAKAILLETHSEHLLLRMLRRVREASESELSIGERDDNDELHFNKNYLSIAFLEPREGGMKLTQIEIDSEGEFVTPWPQGFFTERAEELFG